MAPTTTTVYAIKRGRAPVNTPDKTRRRYVLHLDVVITPAKPLRVGARVKLSELDEIDNPFDNDYDAPKTFSATEVGVVGEIVGIRAMEKEFIEFVVANENMHSPIEYAYLAIKHAHGDTTHLEIWRRLLWWLITPLLRLTRHIPTEDEALILDSRTLPRTDPEAHEYGNGGVDAFGYGLEL
ncbi:hypothetical protein VTO73DRAFT_2677 [Trametes versicolor]